MTDSARSSSLITARSGMNSPPSSSSGQSGSQSSSSSFSVVYSASTASSFCRRLPGLEFTSFCMYAVKRTVSLILILSKPVADNFMPLMPISRELGLFSRRLLSATATTVSRVDQESGAIVREKSRFEVSLSSFFYRLCLRRLILRLNFFFASYPCGSIILYFILFLKYL